MSEQGRVEAVPLLASSLWRSLLAYTGDAELASDAEAEAFAQVLGRGEAVDNVAAWVWRSAFRIASGLRAARSLSNDPRATEGSTSPTGSRSPSSWASWMACRQQRACVVLRYVGEYSSTRSPSCSGPVRAPCACSCIGPMLRCDTIMEAEHA